MPDLNNLPTSGNDMRGMFKDSFNTEIPPELMPDFEKWVEKESKVKGRDVKRDLEDYDLQGYWLETGGKGNDERGHGPDKFKKPNHPTFSTDSKYHGKDFQGGTWKTDESGKSEFVASPHNIKNLGRSGLSSYFDKYERGTKLSLPTTGQ